MHKKCIKKEFLWKKGPKKDLKGGRCCTLLVQVSKNLLVGCLIFDVHFAMCDVACAMHKGYTVQMELFGRPN